VPLGGVSSHETGRYFRRFFNVTFFRNVEKFRYFMKQEDSKLFGWALSGLAKASGCLLRWAIIYYFPEGKVQSPGIIT
jgi:hypothetical protein